MNKMVHFKQAKSPKQDNKDTYDTEPLTIAMMDHAGVPEETSTKPTSVPHLVFLVIFTLLWVHTA